MSIASVQITEKGWREKWSWIRSRRAHLSRYCYLSVVLHSRWTILPIRIVEDYRDRGLRDASLSAFVDEILLILCTHLKTRNAIRGRER